MLAPVLAMSLYAAAQSAGEPLCGSIGTLYQCTDTTQAPICWDSRQQRLVACAELPKDKDGTLKRTLWIVGGNSFDILTTGIGINRGAREGNPILATPEIRWGSKGITAVAEIALVEFAARVLKRPRLATWIARGLGAAYGVVGLRNLRAR